MSEEAVCSARSSLLAKLMQLCNANGRRLVNFCRRLGTRETPLMAVSYLGELTMAQRLLRGGANPLAKDVAGRTAQAFALINGFRDVARLIEEYVATHPWLRRRCERFAGTLPIRRDGGEDGAGVDRADDVIDYYVVEPFLPETEDAIRGEDEAAGPETDTLEAAEAGLWDALRSDASALAAALRRRRQGGGSEQSAADHVLLHSAVRDFADHAHADPQILPEAYDPWAALMETGDDDSDGGFDAEVDSEDERNPRNDYGDADVGDDDDDDDDRVGVAETDEDEDDREPDDEAALVSLIDREAGNFEPWHTDDDDDGGHVDEHDGCMDDDN
jgi:hypothetical protein